MSVEARYHVVRNDEEQYSVYPVGRSMPLGWIATGFEGTKADCLDHIEAVWTDMRPKSLRVWMENASADSKDHDGD